MKAPRQRPRHSRGPRTTKAQLRDVFSLSSSRWRRRVGTKKRGKQKTGELGVQQQHQEHKQSHTLNVEVSCTLRSSVDKKALSLSNPLLCCRRVFDTAAGRRSPVHATREVKSQASISRPKLSERMYVRSMLQETKAGSFTLSLSRQVSSRFLSACLSLLVCPAVVRLPALVALHTIVPFPAFWIPPRLHLERQGLSIKTSQIPRVCVYPP